MGVDQRGCADDLARHTEVAAEESVARIMDKIRAIDPLGPHHSVTSGHCEDDVPFLHNDGETPVTDPALLLQELENHTRKAELGESASARRVAELLELMHRPEEADSWWRRASVLGDAAATAYVTHILR